METQNPQNPVPQINQPDTSQPQVAPPDIDKKKRPKVLWWIIGSACTVLIILAIVGAVFVLKGLGENSAKNGNDFLQGLVDALKTNDNDGPGSLDFSEKVNEITGKNEDATPDDVLVTAETAISIDEETGQAVNPTNVFSKSQEKYYLILQLRGAKNTSVSVEWLQNTELVEDYTLDDIDGDIFLDFFLDVSQSDANVRVGDYEAKVYLNEELVETVSFTVTSN